MIIYNVTVKVNKNIAEAWLVWLRMEHIPDIIGTTCFKEATVLHLLDTDDSEGPTFAIQYLANSKDDVDRYLDQYAMEMRARGTSRWGENFIAFRSILEVIN